MVLFKPPTELDFVATYMQSQQKSLTEKLANLCRSQISQAGQRYTPSIDPNAPNLRIAPLSTAIDNLACDGNAQMRFESVLNDFAEAWKLAKHHSQKSAEIEFLLNTVRASLQEMMHRLRSRDASAGNEWINKLSEIDANLVQDLSYWRTKEAKLSKDNGNNTSEHNTIRTNLELIDRCLRIIREEVEFSNSPSFKLLSDPLLLISGEWGTGKTHLLCDVTSERLSRDAPTVLVLAKNFEGNVLKDICTHLHKTASIEEIFKDLEIAGQGANGRTILIIDGINEGRRREWQQAINTLLSLVAIHPNIGIVVTCRTPFEAIAIKKADLEKFQRLQHYGFDDQEFDAQAAFFQYYQLPLPEVPLLDREFSRPLTLKLICQSLQSLSRKKQAKGFAGIASGLRGMTFILESFIKRIGQPIEQKFNLKDNGCWVLMKGDDQITNHKISGIAPCMAENLRGYVLRSEINRIIAASQPSLLPIQRQRLIEEMRTNGLIDEDVIWYSTKSGQYKSRIVYRMPYQRFSDHLIARHLLKTQLNPSSPTSIKRSFATNSLLGKVFLLKNRNYGQFAEPGWAQALITEFPERVKKKIPRKQQELFFWLPQETQNLNAYFEPFIEGLFWRNPTAFTEGTRLIINKYLGANSNIWERVIDTLTAIATKPNHPYHAKRLYKYLSNYPMADRDLQWSEYLRRKYASPTIHRLLTWAEKLDTVEMTQASAVELVVLFSLILTTVVRNDRDLATKALLLIGEQYPDILFSHTIECLEFNDPYLPERVLAAAYGTTLSLIDSKNASLFRPLLGKFAKKLYLQMFAPRGQNATHHTLMRDYALGIIEVAQRSGCLKLSKVATQNTTRPFPNTPSSFTNVKKPNKTVTDAIGHAIHMDFGNYTIGRLIPNRQNYDFNNQEYIQVRTKIERRIFELGYRKEQFKHVDDEIAQNSWNARNEHKIDRYGKKYSWIAYYEMWGERDANYKLPDWRMNERTSDCNIDPTFPKAPPDWIPPLPDLFGPPTATTEDWVAGGFTPDWRSLLVTPEINGHQGEWVLLEGFIQRSDSSNDREIFSFLRGMFVANKNVDTLRSHFLSTDYPGNHKIPDGGSEHYLFAGEPSHRDNYAKKLLKKNGQYRRQMAEAFDKYECDYSGSKKKSLAIVINSISNTSTNTKTDPFFEIDVPITRHIPGVLIELPTIQFCWESYHSAQNSFTGFYIPEPSIIQRLKLFSRNREVDYFDKNGQPAILFRQAGKDYFGNKHKLLYIRADLLHLYLKKTRQVLAWCSWGERDWLHKMDEHYLPINKSREKVFQTHKHIHRAFNRWSAKKGFLS